MTERARPRLAVGIDLGTTHTALASRPLDGDGRAEVFGIPQLVAPATVEPRPLLPSVLYVPHEAELPAGAADLPWPDGALEGAPRGIVGEWARALGAQTPVRAITSAKSWLSHPSLDRRAASLPAGSPEEVPKVSPVEASARFLAHLAAAWDFTVARGDGALALAAQDLTLTVPASFDAAARSLTVEAARRAGLGEPTLLEEPQAAMYAWIDAMGDRWRRELAPGDLVLVVDIGGGTTDFSLIAVVDRAGDLGLERVAVGDHILLGGDNMDLALAHALESRAARGGKLDRWQLLALTHAARAGKEALFADPARRVHPVSIPGRGSSLVGGALGADLTREELETVLVEGFFPRVAAAARPAAARRTGLTALGLPYASDPAITRHLAAFLSRHRAAITEESAPGLRLAGRAFLHPTAILFNGGVMKARALEARVREVVGAWVAEEGGREPRPLPEADPDLAVALGAATYGRVRAGNGIRIRGGTARAYYVGVEAAMPAVPGIAPPVHAVCLAPIGMEEGTRAELPGEEVGLVVGETARFRLFGSAVRREDRPGAFVEDVDALEELPPVETALMAEGRPAGEVVPVRLRAHVTEIGTLELECVERGGASWRLEWNLRAGAEGGEEAPAGEADAAAAPPGA